MTSGSWNPGFQDSRKALELACFDWFQNMGYHSHSFLSRNLILNVEFENYINPGNFQKFPGTLDIDLELASFDWFQYIGYIFHSILVKDLDFQCKIWKLNHYWKFPGQYPEFQEISESFQEWFNFQIQHWKSSSLTKIEWEIYPIYWNQSKLANSKAFLES